MHKEIYLQLKSSICAEAEDAYEQIQLAINAKKYDDEFLESCINAERLFSVLSTCLEFCHLPFVSYQAKLLAQICSALKVRKEISTDEKWDISYSATVFIAYLNNVGLWNSELPVVIFEAVYLLENILKTDISDGGRYIQELSDSHKVCSIELSAPQKEFDADVHSDSLELFIRLSSDICNNKNYYSSCDKLSNMFLYISSYKYPKKYRVIFFLAAHLFDLIGSDFIKVNKSMTSLFNQIKVVFDSYQSDEKQDDKFCSLLSNLAFLIVSCSTRSVAAKQLIKMLGNKPFNEDDIGVIKSFTTKDDLDLLKTIFISLYQNIEQVIEEYKELGGGLITPDSRKKIKETFYTLNVIGADSFFEPLSSYIEDVSYSEELISCLNYLNSQIELFIESPDLELFSSGEVDVIDKEINRRLSRECLAEIKDIQSILNKVDQQRLPPEMMDVIPDHLNLAMLASRFLPFEKITDILYSLKVFFSNFEINFDIFPYPQYANDIADVLYSVQLYFENYSNNVALDDELLVFAGERLKRNDLFFEFNSQPDESVLQQIELRNAPFPSNKEDADQQFEKAIEDTNQFVESILSIPLPVDAEPKVEEDAKKGKKLKKASLMRRLQPLLIVTSLGILSFLLWKAFAS